MQCYVYRSKHKRQTYLFLPEKDNFSQVPESLLQLFGIAEFSFEFELRPGRQMIMTDTDQVIRNLEENGFFLQLPPAEDLTQRRH
ncbi:MAG: YcgL domain-containing protein [Thiolinea sp.]